MEYPFNPDKSHARSSAKNWWNLTSLLRRKIAFVPDWSASRRSRPKNGNEVLWIISQLSAVVCNAGSDSTLLFTNRLLGFGHAEDAGVAAVTVLDPMVKPMMPPPLGRGPQARVLAAGSVGGGRVRRQSWGKGLSAVVVLAKHGGVMRLNYYKLHCIKQERYIRLRTGRSGLGIRCHVRFVRPMVSGFAATTVVRETSTRKRSRRDGKRPSVLLFAVPFEGREGMSRKGGWGAKAPVRAGETHGLGTIHWSHHRGW
jgi:hypothetical protein